MISAGGAERISWAGRHWKAYRRNLADAARPASESRKEKAASRPDAVRVTDQTDGGKGGKPVLRLSAGAPPEGTKTSSSTSDRARMLEEEIVAQGKALNEANERIKQLEKALQNASAADRAQ